MRPIEESVILITGATDGIGERIARDLAERGGGILLHGRQPKKGRAVLKEIKDATGNENIEYYNADFSSLGEVRKLAKQVQADHDRLHILINNAGIGFGAPGSERELSKDGYELRFQVNYLSCFLLTMQLLGLLRRSAPARIVNVASAGQHALDFDNIMLENNYAGQRAYRQSKLAQIMFTFDLAGMLKNSEITVNALHPATYMDTKLVRNSGVAPISTVREGAEAVEYLAFSQELEGVTGKYFNGKKQAHAHEQAYDEDVRQRLWDLSEELTGIETGE